MRFALPFIASLWFCISGAGVIADDSPPPIRILLIGDSTVATYANPPADRPDLTGWGQVLGEFLTDQVTVINHAKSGRSSRSFIREGLWKKALAEKADYVFIQFGHNDQPGKGDRTTDPDGDYQDFLRQYISDARAAGMKPVLVTPAARRTFVDGKIHTTLTPYAEAMQKVGRETETPVTDLHAASMALFAELGDEGSADLSAAASDRTHFSRKGGLRIAKLVADALPEAVPGLGRYLKPGDGGRCTTARPEIEPYHSSDTTFTRIAPTSTSAGCSIVTRGPDADSNCER